MAALKVKYRAEFICSGCGSVMLNFPKDKGWDTFLSCIKSDCPNHNKKYELPEIEVKEYEDRDGEKSD